jgi:HD superfamily phosphohydrolase
MDTRAFQRLRRIRQLAMAHLVYPGALHTRFDHSIGTMHLAGRMCEGLSLLGHIQADEMRVVRLAALLHDIGHGPFSHVSEYLLDRHYDREELGEVGPAEKIHERLTVDIIQRDRELAKILGDDLRHAIVQLISEPATRNFKRDIVSSSVDADKMDYLLRDSHFAGVQYGRFDLDKMIDACRIYERGEESYLAFDHEGIYALEQLVLAKYHMSQQVYYHRVRAITDSMLVRGLNIAIRRGLSPAASLFRYDGSPAFMERYLQLHDEGLIQMMSEIDDEKVRELFSRLSNRWLLREICFFPVDEVANGLVRDKLSRLEFESHETEALETVIARELGDDPEFVIVTRQSIKNPTFRSPSLRLNEEEIIVLDSSGTPRTVSDFPDLIFSLNRTAASREAVRVFARRDDWRDPQDTKVDERSALQEKIKELIIGNVA